MTADDVRLAWRDYAIRCTAHRIRKFGFEHHINMYEPAELRVLASMSPPLAARAIMREADTKEAYGHG